MAKSGKKQIIMMADIIGSRYKDNSSLMMDFRKLIDEINQKCSHRLLSPLTITLGDEFQGVARSFRDAAETIISIEESIISQEGSYKLRYVVLEGKIETPVNPKSAHAMLGAGLTMAREILNSRKGDEERIFIKLENAEKSRALNGAFHIFEWIVDGWKEKDYQLIEAFWKYQDYKTVASKLNKNVSLMWKRERSLHLKEYRSIKHIIGYML